jgi:hypothetical protein
MIDLDGVPFCGGEFAEAIVLRIASQLADQLGAYTDRGL